MARSIVIVNGYDNGDDEWTMGNGKSTKWTMLIMIAENGELLG